MDILERANVIVDCPEQGNDEAEKAEVEGDYLLAAACKKAGAACCLGHKRAARMNNSSVYLLSKLEVRKMKDAYCVDCEKDVGVRNRLVVRKEESTMTLVCSKCGGVNIYEKSTLKHLRKLIKSGKLSGPCKVMTGE